MFDVGKGFPNQGQAGEDGEPARPGQTNEVDGAEGAPPGEEADHDRPAPVLSRLVLVATPFALLALFFLIEWWVTR